MIHPLAPGDGAEPALREQLGEAILNLKAFGDEEVTLALKQRDRDSHQFWQGWLGALQRMEAVLASSQSPQEKP